MTRSPRHTSTRGARPYHQLERSQTCETCGCAVSFSAHLNAELSQLVARYHCPTCGAPHRAGLHVVTTVNRNRTG